MSVPAKLAAFVAALLAVFATAFGIGAATEPGSDEPGPTVTTDAPTSTTSPAMDMDHGTEHGS